MKIDQHSRGLTFLFTLVSCLAPVFADTGPPGVACWEEGAGGNGHGYALVLDSMSWDEAREAAESLTALGVPGHLATITSPEEQAFVEANFDLSTTPWLGGAQAAGGAEPDEGWRWITGETWSYHNWGGSEPGNNYAGGFGVLPLGSSEDVLHFWNVAVGTWNDLPRNPAIQTPAYLVEFAPEGYPTCSPVSELTHWYPMEGDGTDVIGGVDAFVNASLTTVDEPETPGFAFLFNELPDWLSAPHATTMNPSTDGFTVECWLRGSPGQVNDIYTVIDKSHGFVDDTGWAIQGRETTNELQLVLGQAGGGFAQIGGDAFELDEEWHHVAGTYDGSNARLFIDGVLVDEQAVASVANNDRQLFIGRAWGGGSATRFFSGAIDEVSIYQTPLTQTQIAAIYEAGAFGKCVVDDSTPETSIVAHYSMNDSPVTTLEDQSGQDNDGTIEFAVASTESPFRYSNTSLAFLDDFSRVEVPNAPSLAPVDAMSLEAWVRLSTTAGTGQVRHLLSKELDDDRDTYQIYIDEQGVPVFAVSNASVQVSAGGVKSIDDGSWHHVVGTLSEDTVSLYVDGVLVANAPFTGTLAHATTPLVLGNTWDTGWSGGLYGELDEVKLRVGTLSPEQVRTIFQFPPDLVSYWPGEIDGRDVMGLNPAFLLNGLAVGGYFEFDGIDDFMYVSPSESLAIESSFTIVGRVRVDDTEDAPLIEYHTGGATCDSGPFLRISSDQAIVANPQDLAGDPCQGQGIQSVATPSGLACATTGLWNDFAWVVDLDAQEQKLFVDSTEVYTEALAPITPRTDGLALFFGYQPGGEFLSGALDEVAIFDRALTSDEVLQVREVRPSGDNTLFPFGGIVSEFGGVGAYEGITPFTTIGATTDWQSPACTNSGNEVWFLWESFCDGVATISTCDSDFDTVLNVFNALDFNAVCDVPAPLACDDDGCGTPFGGSGIELQVSSGDIYLIRVAGFHDGFAPAAQGSGTLSIECEASCGPGSGDLSVIVGLEGAGAVSSETALIDALAPLQTEDNYTVLLASGLDGTEECSLGCGDVIWVLLGTFPENHTLSPEEGLILVNHLSNGASVYIEGADYAFDTITSFAAYDGVASVNDGDDSFQSMTGSDHIDLSLSGLTASYTQDSTGDDSTDWLSPTAEAGGDNAGVVWSSTGGAEQYDTAVFYKTTAPYGDVLVQSWEFGGYGGDQQDLARRYREALQLGCCSSCVGLRGDVNLDGMINLGDVIYIYGYLFNGGPMPLPCSEVGDINGDSTLNLADGIRLGYFLFGPEPPPVSPGYPLGDCLDF